MKRLMINSAATLIIFLGSFLILPNVNYAAGANANECCAANGACCTCQGACGADAKKCWCNE